MMVRFCGIINCGNKAGSSGKSFFRLPSDLSKQKASEEKRALSTLRRKKWLIAIRRDDLTETKKKYLLICEDHFISRKPALLEDINHPDWVPSVRLGYGKTSDCKYIRCLRDKVLKHTKTSLQLQSFAAESTSDDVDNIDASITDSTHDIKGYLFKNDINSYDIKSDTTNDSQKEEDSNDDVTENDQNTVDTDDDYTNGCQRKCNSQGQMCSNNKIPFDNAADKVPSDNVYDKVHSGSVDDLGDCNLSSSFLNNLTKFQQTSSVSVHVQTDLKTTDLDYLNKYCEVTRRKLAEANRKIKLLNTILNLKQRGLKTH